MRKMNGTNTTPTAAKNVQIELNGEIQTVRSFKPFKNGSNLGSITTVRWEFAVIFVGFVLLIICPVISFVSLDANDTFASIGNVYVVYCCVAASKAFKLTCVVASPERGTLVLLGPSHV